MVEFYLLGDDWPATPPSLPIAGPVRLQEKCWAQIFFGENTGRRIACHMCRLSVESHYSIYSVEKIEIERRRRVAAPHRPT